MSSINLVPVDGDVGVEIQDVDLSKDLSDSTFLSIQKAFIDHGLIFFRNQNLTPEQHLKFASRWGDININRFFAKVKGYEQIAEVKKEGDQKGNIGGEWHTDHSYD